MRMGLEPVSQPMPVYVSSTPPNLVDVLANVNANAAAGISIAGLTRILTILHDALEQRFAVAAPRIAICGLNPHAGENGHLGREEIDIIRPAVDMFRTAGHDVSGPLPADTVFAPDQRKRQVEVEI